MGLLTLTLFYAPVPRRVRGVLVSFSAWRAVNPEFEPRSRPPFFPLFFSPFFFSLSFFLPSFLSHFLVSKGKNIDLYGLILYNFAR